MFYHCTKKNKIDKKFILNFFVAVHVYLILDEKVAKKLREIQETKIRKTSKSVSISGLIQEILLEKLFNE